MKIQLLLYDMKYIIQYSCKDIILLYIFQVIQVKIPDYQFYEMYVNTLFDNDWAPLK